MNEAEFVAKWESDKPIYSAWGNFVVEKISAALVSKGNDISAFLKIPPKFRLKDTGSLVDKAFYRPDKSYDEPYSQIEDKVGARFVVLLLSDIKEICGVIEACDAWSFDACKHFDKDKEKDPLLFTYQSVHYIIKSRGAAQIDGLAVPEGTPCEVQIRTLLQHAHAELTHDAIYKAKKTVRPKIHRTVAKSMALIETTDDFFSEVTQQLNYGPLQENNILGRLDGIYASFVGINPHNQKSALVIWDSFEQFADDKLIDEIQTLLGDNKFLSEIIKKKFHESAFYQQGVVLFVYWMLKKRRQRLLSDWPLSRDLLEPLAIDVGVSTQTN